MKTYEKIAHSAIEMRQERRLSVVQKFIVKQNGTQKEAHVVSMISFPVFILRPS